MFTIVFILYFWRVKLVVGILGLIWKLYIGVVFVITAIIYYPLIVPFLYKESNKRIAFKLFISWSQVFQLLCFYFKHVEWKERIPDGPYIIIANHASYLDIFVMPSLFPDHEFLFLGKSELLKYPLIKTYFKKLNIPIYRGDDRRSARALISAMKAVKKGWSLVIFPEGGIPDNDNPKMIPFKPGAFKIAQNTGVPIIPVTFLNNHTLFSDPTNILGQARPGISKVIVHKPIYAHDYEHMGLEELSEYCHQIINAPLLERYPHLND